jgi:hypothetical protein
VVVVVMVVREADVREVDNDVVLDADVVTGPEEPVAEALEDPPVELVGVLIEELAETGAVALVALLEDDGPEVELEIGAEALDAEVLEELEVDAGAEEVLEPVVDVLGAALVELDVVEDELLVLGATEDELLDDVVGVVEVVEVEAFVVELVMLLLIELCVQVCCEMSSRMDLTSS